MLDVVASLDVGPTSPQFLHLSDVLRTVGTMGHAADCLKTRYIDLSGDDREYWPRFLGREDLCTCSANLHTAAKQPACAAATAELLEYIESCVR